jgi:hypothetical protein
MLNYQNYFISMLVVFSLVACGKSAESPESKMIDLVPKFQKAMCAKTIGCTKDEFAKIPPEFKNMIPPFMQSEEKCVTFFDNKMKEADKKRIEEKKELTMEQVNAFEKCIIAIESTSCDAFKGEKEKVTIPGCEEAEKLSGD